MAKRKVYGECALCRQYGELSFEHIPPKSAGNKKPARAISIYEFLRKSSTNQSPWDTTGMHYENQQAGMGLSALCKQCNNITGSWYADAYGSFANTVLRSLRIMSLVGKRTSHIITLDIYPLRVIKQVLSMFCSVNFKQGEVLKDIKTFVLDQTATGIDKTRYKVCMYFTTSSMTRFVSFAAKVDLRDGTPILQSEIASRPLGFILYLDLPEGVQYTGIDITNFADYEYDLRRTMSFPTTQIKEVNNPFIGDYRSKETIIGGR